MKMDVTEFLRVLSILSFIAPLIFYLIRFGDNPVQNHIVGALVCMCGILDVLLALGRFSVSLLCNAQDVLQFIFLTALYYELIYKKRAVKIMMVGAGIYFATLLICIFQIGFFKNYTILWSLSSII